jgi:glycosyltransferase involved in cell wall biosynthesis
MPRLSVLVPVYNEQATIVQVMEALTKALPEAEVVYVDDGSKDNSLALMKTHVRPQDKVLTQENDGKGSAIRYGIKNVTGDWCVIQDADLEYDPAEINVLMAHAEMHPTDIVFGSRFLRPNRNIYPIYLMGNKVLTGIVNILFGGRLTDSYTCYKLFPTDVLRSLPLTARGFELEAELTAYPLKMGKTIVELPISYNPRTFAEGKKINGKDAIRGIMTLLKIRFEKL